MTLLMLTMQSVYADPAVGNGATINGTTPKLTGVQIGPVSGTVGTSDALLSLTGSTTQLRPASSTQPFTVYNAAGTIANFAFNDAGSLTVYNAITAGGIITSTTGSFVAGSATAGSGVFGVTGAFAPYIGCNGTNNGCNLSFFTNGSGSSATAYITPGGTYTVGSSTYASTSATLNGPMQLTGSNAGNGSYAGIWNDGSNGTIINSATGSSGVRFTTAGSTNGATVTTGGNFTSGLSTYGATSESVNGTSSASGGYTSSSNLALTGSSSAINFSNALNMNFTGNYSTLQLQSSVGGTTVQGINGADLLFTGNISGTATPILSLDNSGDIGLYGTMNAASFKTASSTYGPTSATINGGLTIGGSSTNNNLNVNSGNNIYLNGTTPGSLVTGSSTYGPTGTTVNGPVNATNGIFSGNLTVGNAIYQSPASASNNVTNTTNQFSNSLAVFGSSNTAVSSIFATAANYYNNGSSPSYTGTALAQYGSAATGTTAGLSNANLGEFLFQNGSNGLIGSNGSNIYIAAADNTSPTLFDASGDVTINGPYLALSTSGTATSSTTHYNSNLLKFSSSDYSGSAAVTNTGSFFMRDFGNPGNSYLFFSPPSGATIGGVGINSGSAIFAMLYGISSGVSGWIPGGTGGYVWYNNAQTTVEMSLSDTGLLTLNQPLPVTSGGTGGAIGPGPALTAATAAINTTDTILATDPLGTASLAAGTTFDIKLFGTCTSSASNTSTFTIRFGTTGTTSDATVATLSLTSATSGTAIGFSLDTMLTIRTIGSSATSAAYGTLANGASTGTGTGISVISAGANAYTTSSFNSSVTSGILSISYKSSATTTTTTFQNAIITVNHY